MKTTRSYPAYTVTKKAELSIVQGHPWVYADEITDAPETQPENGALVDVLSQKGRYLGTGFLSLASKIRVRLLSRNANDTFDEAFWQRRFEYAWAYRKTVLRPKDLTCCRVIFGEADQMPGLTVDRFGTVLDCFTHTGSFALNAALGGAAHVTAVDVSESAVEMARRNAARNGLEDRMDFVCEDVFDLLPRLEREGSPYDFIILDPPAFTKARRTAQNAMRGYKEINYRAMRLLPRGGYLATASCSHFASEAMFIKMLHAAAHDAGRQLRQIEVRQQAPDHPILWNVEETDYLKFFLFQVV